MARFKRVRHIASTRHDHLEHVFTVTLERIDLHFNWRRNVFGNCRAQFGASMIWTINTNDRLLDT
jgi:hypothetical protein